ncbi:hypothetical protein K469DRAFT_683129 [Zopfia rhizophila CBS 207.26]|uniref:Uncharacterized protein n=1 Tax=Zopfia rhizophila CBS 207.26 TaxID=1314779 RepID=A0A6A6ECK4_9PEZI|nr:hypothetical protein K469DRAFT_683129 [Zopfia rhizophila CBS 207.26]
MSSPLISNNPATGSNTGNQTSQGSLPLPTGLNYINPTPNLDPLSWPHDSSPIVTTGLDMPITSPEQRHISTPERIWIRIAELRDEIIADEARHLQKKQYRKEEFSGVGERDEEKGEEEEQLNKWLKDPMRAIANAPDEETREVIKATVGAVIADRAIEKARG